MPAFQIIHLLTMLLKSNDVKLNVQTVYTEMIEGQLFEDHRHQDVCFVTTPRTKN